LSAVGIAKGLVGIAKGLVGIAIAHRESDIATSPKVGASR